MTVQQISLSGASPPRPRALQRLSRSRVLQRLEALPARIVFHEPGNASRSVGSGSAESPRHQVTIHHPSAWTRMLTGGALGAAEAWVDGLWTCDDLTALMRTMVRDRVSLARLGSGCARVGAPLLRAWHALRANTRGGSRRNIAAHYDIGNDLFEQMLDRTMTYSCGLFEHDEATLAEASVAKLDRLCQKLDLGPDDHLLEIGTGWGSMAIHAAGRHGCRVTTTTISAEQHRLASERVVSAGLSDRVTVLLEDYRDLRGTFDKIVSVEMIEAVGPRFLNRFVRSCCDRLADDGLLALQAITIADQHYEKALREIDFIKRHIFPGSFIPSVTAIQNAATRCTDLRLWHLEDMAPHYARTLRCWRTNLERNRDRLPDRFDERFVRLWRYYLSYCEAGFDERFLGVAQMLYARPRCRRAAVLPSLSREPAIA